MEWKKIYKPLEKFGIAAVELVIAFAFVYFTENVNYLWLIPVLETARNVLKHRYCQEEVKKKK